MSPCIMGQPGQNTIDTDDSTLLNPGRMFSYSNTDIWFGTWSCGYTTLKIFYEEHQQYRNRWSASNCGFDLVQYKGTTIYMEQHSKWDYLAYFDEEFMSIESFTQQATFHPMTLITHPKAVLIKSRERAGPRRARKVWLPRPSWWDSGWSLTKQVAAHGVFAWFVIIIDLEHPWMDSYFNTDAEKKQDMWWTNTDWKSKFDEYVRTTVQTRQTKKKAPKPVTIGPFMPRTRDLDRAQNVQLTWFYKSHWRWGGNNLTLTKICDPSMDVPVNPTG